MEYIDNIFTRLGASDPLIGYIISGVTLLLTLFFFRKVITITMIVVVVILIYFGIALATGQEVHVDLPENFSVEEVTDFIRSVAGELSGFLKDVFGGLIEEAVDDKINDVVGNANNIAEEEL